MRAVLSITLFLAVVTALQQPPQVVPIQGNPSGSAALLSTVLGHSRPVLKPGQVSVERHLYVAAIDPEAKQPVWVSFTVRRQDWDTDNVLSRNFRTVKELQPFSLEESDYEGSGYDMGHLYGLQFVSASQHAAEVNEVSVIAAQRPTLNRRVWIQAENRIRQLSSAQEVQVLNGQLWLKPMPGLAMANEPHKVASHCYSLIRLPVPCTEEAYLIPQDCLPDDQLSKHKIEPSKLKEMISTQWTNALN